MYKRQAQRLVRMHSQLGAEQRHRLQATLLANDVVLKSRSLSLMDGNAALQVREAEGVYTITAISRTQQVIQSIVLSDAEH